LDVTKLFIFLGGELQDFETSDNFSNSALYLSQDKLSLEFILCLELDENHAHELEVPWKFAGHS